MQVTDDILAWVEDLAKLKFEGSSREQIKKDMSNVLDLCGKLNEVDTTDVDPLVFMSEEVNSLRKDEARIEISKEEALKNAPERDSDYFKVPKVFDRS